MGIETSIGATIAAALGATGTTATIVATAVNLAISAALSAGAAALAGTPDSGPRRASRTANIKQALAPREVVYGVVRKGGVIFYVSGSHFANTRLHLCIALAAHECEEIVGLYVNGQLTALKTVVPADGTPPFEYSPELGPEFAMYVPDTGHARRRFSSYNWRLGTADQTAIPLLVQDNAIWTDDHRARGVCYLYARLIYDVTNDALIWPSFIPSFTVRLKGKNDIYDPRDETTGWTDNPALIAADILHSLLGVPWERIDTAALIAAANVCDEVVSLKEGGTEKRYRCCGYFALEGEPEQWLEPVTNSMAGAVVEHHGSYYIHAGAWVAPEVEITDDDLAGGIRMRTAASDRERANIARGIFASAEAFDQPTDFPSVIDAAAVEEDGQELEMDLDLEFVPSHTQAQRVAKILLRTARSGRTLEVATNLLKGLDVKPWDTVTVNLSSLGISGLFRVVEHVTNLDGSPPTLAPVLTLREVSESIYDWDEVTDEQALALESPIIPGMDLEPDDLQYSTVVNASAGTMKPAVITATWDDPALVDFQAIEVEAIVQFEHKIGLGSWFPASIEAKGEVAAGVGTLVLNIEDEDEPAASYDFRNVAVERVRVRSRVSDNSWGEWVTQEGDLLAPIAVSKTFIPYASKPKHVAATVKMNYSAPVEGTPAAYEIEATITYEWRQGAGAWIEAEYTESRRVKGTKPKKLVLLDRGKPGGTTSFQNHVLTVCRVRSINGDGTFSAWTDL